MDTSVLGAADVARALNVSPSRARTLLRESFTPLSFKMGKKWKILARDLPRACKRVGRIDAPVPSAKGGE